MIRRIARERGGSVTVVMAGLAIVGAAFAALAVDLGAVYVGARRLQGLADAAALAAAADPASADSRARAIIAASGWPEAALARIETGRYTRDPALAPDARFASGTTAPDAARATVRAAVPLRFAALIGRRSVTLIRRATGARVPTAAFSIGSRLAAIDGGVANALTSALLGGTIALSVADYRALADARVDMFAFSDALRTRLGLTAATYDEVLAAQTDLPTVLAAAADALGAGSAATAARQLAATAPTRAMSAAALFDPGSAGQRVSAGGLQAAASVLDLAQAAIIVSGGRRQVAIPLGATVPGLAATTLTVAIGERPAHSPWMTIAADGGPVVRTAQVRVHLDTRVGVSGLAGIASLHVPLFVEMAEAEARLSSLSCAAAPAGGVTLAVKTAVGHASIAAVDTRRLDDFTTPLAEGPVTLAGVGLIGITANMRLPVGGSGAQQVPFTRADIAAGTAHTVSSGAAVGTLAAALLARPGLSVTVGPLGLGLSLVTGIVGSALAVAAPVLDRTLDGVLDLVGVHLGQADVTVGGLRCGRAALVA